MTALTIQRTRAPVRLGQQLGCGGEGVVSAIDGTPDRVAKVYLTPPGPQKIEKLQAMVRQVDTQLATVAAWPTDVLVDSIGAVRGFVMPHVAKAHHVHKLYSPKSRVNVFPTASFEFLVHVATNIARAFAVMHQAGIVIGDVNHGNILVRPDGTILLIDCDSFQIGLGARIFTCDVGAPLFTAPELQGFALRGVKRTPEHDLFGLATLLFHLLYLGRHPFAGRYLGPGDMPIEKAISDYRFAYGRDHRSLLMERPPGTLELADMGQEVARGFEQAFRRLSPLHGRTDAIGWVTILGKLKVKLRKCSIQSEHQYHSELVACPWCPVESYFPIPLFRGSVVTQAPANAVNVEAVWRAIVAVPGPDTDPPLPEARADVLLREFPKPRVQPRFLRRLAVFGIVTSVILCVMKWPLLASVYSPWSFMTLGVLILVILTVPDVTAKEARWNCDNATSRWKEVYARWEREATRKIFLAELTSLERTKKTLIELERERSRRIDKLEASREAKQLNQYLDSCRIDDAPLRGIGQTRKSMLVSYGIETALDVEASRLTQVPGFGEVLTAELLNWRAKCAGQFVYNSAIPVDAGDLAVIHRDIDARKQIPVRQLNAGPAQLEVLRQRILDARERLAPELDRSWVEWKTADRALKSL